MRSALLAFAVVATRLFTSMREPAPKMTPLGLMMTMLPLALRLPSIIEAPPLPTRLTVSEWLVGCTKFVVSPEPISKPRQSMTALSEDWLTVRVLPMLAMLAEPAATTPSTGFASTAIGATLVSSATSRVALCECWVNSFTLLPYRCMVNFWLKTVGNLHQVAGISAITGQWVSYVPGQRESHGKISSNP
jgi:hypothetical protein